MAEVKDRTKFPTWIATAVLNARSYAKSHQLPFALITGRSAPIDLVVLDLRDFLDHYGKDMPLEVEE